jgi:hypothetical protein
MLTLVHQACQSVGWNEKGHKADCKLLKDNDLKNAAVKALPGTKVSQR